MDRLTPELFAELLSDRSGTCVTMYMPTHPVSARETREDVIRFKNLLAEAEEAFAAYYRRPAAMTKRFSEIRRLVSDEGFWKHQTEGLAIFLSPERSVVLKLPLRLPELVRPGEDFYLVPLLHLLAYDQPYYVLTLSQESVRLFRGDRTELIPEEVWKLPQNIREDLWYRETEREMRHRGISPGHSGRSIGGSYHGHGDETHEARSALEEFLRHVDRAVVRHLRRSSDPLILAGVEPTLGLYRKIQSYRALADEAIEQRPDRLDRRELHRRVTPLIQRLAEQPKRKLVERYFELAGNRPELVTTDPGDILEASRRGRVDVLLVGTSQDEGDGLFFEAILPAPPEVDGAVVNEAFTCTLQTKGLVIPVETDEIPGGFAAILRY